jgi:predicted ATPase
MAKSQESDFSYNLTRPIEPTGFDMPHGSYSLGEAAAELNMIRLACPKCHLSARPEGQMLHWAFIGQIMMGWAIGSAGRLEGGIALITKGLNTGENLGYGYGALGIHWPHYRSLFAMLQARAGNMHESLSAINQSKELLSATGEYFWHADVLRMEGELGLLFGRSLRKSEDCFVQALEIARKQQAKSFELRAVTSLARLRRDQGRLADGRDLLRGICDWFTEGFGTSDWLEAKEVLRQLA